MLSRTCSVSLVVLILLPLSAPLAACDFVTIFPTLNRHAMQARGTSSLMPSRGIARAHALPFVGTRIAGRIRFVASECRGVASVTVAPRSRAYHGPVAPGFVGSAFVSPLRI